MHISTRRRFIIDALGAGAGAAALAALPPMALGQETPPPHPHGNVFISPPGKPFRAKPGQPYPVVDWFKEADKNGDGKIDHAEFIADSAAYFKYLDRNGDGVLSPIEIELYEQRIAPEVLGYSVLLEDWRSPAQRRGLLWRAQIQRPDPIDPGGGGEAPEPPLDPHTLDESGVGASPYGFFDEPEPVTAADLNFRGLVYKADFLKLAEIHFTTLDRAGVGFLTLETLPKTPVQKDQERLARRRHRA